MSFYDRAQKKEVFVRQEPAYIQGQWGFMLHYCKYLSPASQTLLFQDNGLPLITMSEYSFWRENNAMNQAKDRRYKNLKED